MLQFPLALPSPTQSIWFLGFIPIRAYAICILIAIAVAIKFGGHRLAARGGKAHSVLDIAGFAIPAGIIGARVYHVMTSWQPYFGADGHPLNVFKIWEGGLSIWGAIGGGAAGAYIACRRQGVSMRLFADALAPALPLAQAIGRIGNWFNNEIYGRPTELPWGLKVHAWDVTAGEALRDANGALVFVPGLRHPTFLYEALWCVLIAVILIFADRKYRLVNGRCFLLYVMLYTVGRFFIERLRDDEANLFLGHRLNEWTSGLLFVAAAVMFIIMSRRVSRGARRRLSATATHLDAGPATQDG